MRPEDRERRVAREIVIRLADRRVLNAFECCDSCIDQQVELADLADGPLYLLLDMMREGIRQFLTFEQRLGDRDASEHPWERHRERDVQELYFAGLEALRAHLHRCLIQVAAIADIEIPGIAAHMRYDPAWALEAYTRPALSE